MECLILPLVMGSELGPLPSKLVAITLTVMLVDEGQNDEFKMSNLWTHIPTPQEEAGMMADPQELPKVESK